MLSQKPNELRTVVWMLRDRGIETTPANLESWIMTECAGVVEHFDHFVEEILSDNRSFEAFASAFSDHCVFAPEEPAPTREIITNHIIHRNTHSTRTDWNATTVAAILGIAIGILAAILGGWAR